MSASEEVAALGGTQRFECQVVGYPSPIVTWFKDEVDITQDPRYNIHFDQVRGVIALTIREVLPTDEGCYQCRAQNSEGYATTTAYLVVRVDHGLSRGFRSMLVSEKISEQESSQMQMASANKQRVIEEVITRYEESEKEVIEEKLFPPKLTYDCALSDGVQLKAGSTLYIEVGVSGIPFPSVAWKHGDTLLKEDARITMEDDPSGYSYLKVKGTTREDEGTYKVMAENTVGKDEASFNIVIRGTPTAPRNLHIQEVYKDYIVIRWEAPEQDGGFPITSYNIEKSLSGGTFLSVNQVLPSEHEFKVTRLYEGSEYMFRVSAENKAGVGAFATTDKPTKARLPFDPPGKPRDLMVTSVDKDSVGLSWEAPESDGGALITSFIVERKDVMRASSMWAIAATVDGTTRSLMVGKLFTGNCYHFRVFAENRVGPGEPATLDDGVIAKLPYDSPGPARNIRAVETNVDYIVLEWDPPESDGGSPLTSYIVEKRDARRKEFIYIADIGPECTQFKATRLFEGYEYYFRVFAENIVGPSEPCEMEKPVRAKLPYDEPYPPHSLRVTDYWTDFITIEWEGPENDGGSPLTGYVIEKRDALRQSWIKAGNVGPDVNNFKVTNLFEGTDYVLRVFAENKVGPSLTAAELEKPQRAKMPYDAPMAPQSLTTSDVTSESVTVSWTAPANDGGAEITRYAIEKRDAMRMTWGVCGYTEPGVNTFTVEGLIAGDNYFFRVAAENKVGRGDYVELIHPITAKMPYDKPGPPSNLRTTDVWKNYITIAWEAPEYDGGAPILGYHIEIRDTMKAEFRDVGKTAANVTEFQVGCLEEGRDYYFRVFACNKAGVGENPSSLKPAVKAQLPYDRPSAPTALTVVGTGKGTISITWGLPDNEGGSPVTGYTIEACHAREPDNYKPVGTVEATILDYTITDLIDGGDYFVRVRAENAAGLSDEAAQTDLPVCAREPKTAPEAPGALTVTSVTSESVTVTWSAPASDGGSKVTSYTVEVREVGMTFTPAVEVDGSTLTATLPGLTPEKAYEIQVFAKNSEGLSSPVMLAEPFKTEPAPVTMTPPSAPKGLRVTEVRSDAITITWEAPESDGGSPVTHYVVVIKDAASTKKFRKAGRVDANTMTLTVTDKIKPGHEYNMVVYGENEAGVSDDGAELATPVMVPEPQPVVEPQAVVEELVEMVESAPVEAAKPKAVPGTPGNARCEAVTSEGFTLTWDAPADSGGSIITKYTIVMRDVEKKKFKSVGEVDGTTTSFLVDKVKSEHEYVLRVYAENEVGLSAESEISEPIKVPAKKSEDTVDAKGPAPEIVTAPEPVAIAEGETIRLTCKVKGEPEPSLTWFKDDQKLRPQDDPRVSVDFDMKEDLNILLIEGATKSDEGAYRLEVTNDHGTVSVTVMVTVEGPAPCEPTIEAAPEPVEFAEGDSITLSCKVSGTPTPEVKWYKDDKKFKSKDTRITAEFDAKQDLYILTVKEAVRSDEGSYKVKVTNEKGSVQVSVMCTVKITEEAIPACEPKIEVAPEPVEFTEGESFSLSVKISGTPAPEVKWYKDDHKFKSKDKRITADFDATQDLYILTVKDAVRSDEGSYKVKITNEKGSVQVSVMVTAKGGDDKPKVAPTLQSVPEPVTVMAGETIRLTVGVTADPEAEITWIKDDKKIKKKKKDAHVKMDYDAATGVHFLEIKESTIEDGGTYVVTATNINGSVSHTVTVTVSKGAEKAPEFTNKPGAVNAHEFDPVTINANISGEPTVTWFKEGKPLKDTTVRTSQDGDMFSLIIASASLLDAGEYTIAANNAAGGTFHTVNVSIEAATEKETEEEDKDLAVVEKLLPKINAEKEKLKDSDQMLFKAYPCLEDYSDAVRGVELKKGDVVEVMDTEKDDEWLVRKQDDKEKVCYVPVEILLGRKKHDDSSGDEELTDQAEAFPIYQAIADYNPPPPPDHLKLKEGQFVEVLDMNNAERWLCRTKPTKNKEPQTGWVPPSYLVAKRGDVRTPREQFREDVLQLDNKEQEAAMKCRYALEDLWESERDYIRDLSFAMDTYYPKFDGDLPDALKGKKEVVFSTFPEIKTFHGDKFLADLLKCTSNANSVGQCFLDHTADFQMYVPYYLDREQVSYLLNLEEPLKFIKDHDKAIGNLGESKLSLPQYLARPTERITEYINILRDFMKYSARAGEEVEKAEEAIKMLLALQRKAEDDSALMRIVGYPGDLSALGPINRHDDFVVWDGELTGKSKERHLFLFNDKLMLTKKKKPKNAGEPITYEFKSLIDLPDVQLNEHLDDERRFALWYADPKTDRVTFQARNVHVKQAWCDDLRRCMKSLAEESDVSAYHSAVEEEPSAPTFTAGLQPVTCTEGEPVRLTCQLGGHPVPDITWSRDGAFIIQSADFKFEADGDKFSLFLPKASRDMTGKYTITATNSSGTITCEAELTVEPEHVAPSFKSKLKDVNTALGEQARFQVRITGVPEPEVVWTHNGDEVKSGDRFKFLFEDEETQVLIIEDITTADEGTYKVKATNALGKKSSSANLTTSDQKFKAPTFTSGLKDMTVAAGLKAKFSCRITGKPEPEVTWLYDGEVVKPDKSINKMSHDADSVTLTLKSVTSADAGKYTCRVTNTAGTCDSVATLTVEGGEDEPAKLKPRFTGKMKDVDAMKGEKVQFHCVVDGNPRPVLTWYHNQQALVETERIMIYTLDCEHTLVLTTTMMSDEGEYTAKAVSETGEVSCVAKLFMTEDTLKEPEMEMAYSPTFAKKISNQAVPLGMIARFTAKCIGVPDPDTTWQKEGVTLEASDHVKFERDGNQMTLMISNTQVEDAGTYTCIVTNSAGENKCNATLVIETPIPREPIRSSVDREENLQPPVMPMDKPYLTDIDVSNFQLSWGPAILPPKAKPTLIRYCLEQCKLPGSDWITIQSDLDKESTLVSEFDPLKDYMYRIKAYNDAGFSDPTNAASVFARNLDPSLLKREPVKDKLPPRPVRDKPVIFDVTHETLKLSWQPSELPTYAVQTPITYIVERRCPPSKNWIEVGVDIEKTEWTMLDYKTTKDYMFRIRAHNEYGSSDPSMSSTLFCTPAEEEKPKKESKEEPKAKVKPRTIWEKPDIYDITSETCMLKWKLSSLPNYAEQTPIHYIVEKREPPNTDWIRLTGDCETNSYQVKHINRKQDYYFRIRATNEHGTSEPSMPSMLRREEVDTVLEDAKKKKKETKEEENIPTRRVPLHMRIIPEFIGKTDENQYGVEGRTAKIYTYIRGYPEPTIMWFVGGEKIELRGAYNCTLSPQGELVLEIEKFSWSHVGDYKVYMENEFGSASMIIKLDMADPPTFLEPMKDQVMYLRRDGKLECRVHGIPYPTVTFKHDWRVIANGHRVKISREDYDHWTLNVNTAIYMDEGMYECVAENLAGKVYCTASVKVNEKAGLRDIRFNPVPIEDYFHIIDELGRGAYGVVRRVIDKNSGNQYAAKFLRFPDHLVKSELETELEILTLLDHPGIIQLIDGYEDKKRLILVMEVVTGGELLQRLVKDDALTESEVAFYIRQLLLSVEHMHAKSVVHMDLKLENLFLAQSGSDELKLIDFGFARRWNPRLSLRVKYATPEYAAPEVAAGDDVTPAADMWSIGVIVYILLSGLSPFHKGTARETLLNIKEGKFEFDAEAFTNISNEAKAFISRCLTKDPKKRISATEAIDHDFIELSHHRGLGDRINLEKIRGYMFRRKWEHGQESVKTFAQPRPLSEMMAAPPAMLPPGMEVEVDVPILDMPGFGDAPGGSPMVKGPSSDHGSVGSGKSLTLEAGAAGMLQVMGPMSLLSGAPSTVGSGGSSEWGREYEDEDTWYEWSSSYQTGPDTFLIPKSDSGLSMRLASYRRAGSKTKGGKNGVTAGSSRMSMRERRDLRDLDKAAAMADDEGPSLSKHHGKRSVWLLKSMIETADGTSIFPPIFKEKIRDKAYNVGDACTLRVHVIGNPTPAVSWYRNDELLTDGGRVRTSHTEEGRYSLTIISTKPNDFGVYKCIARNKHGKVTCRARMLLGDCPGRPGRPHVTKVSDREIYQIWEEPESDGNSYILAYRVDWHRPGDERWTTATYSIDEQALVKGLVPDTTYRFRIAAINKFGISPYSWASVEIRTKKTGSSSIDIDSETKRILLRSRQAQSRPSPDPSPATSPAASVEDLSKLCDDKDLGMVEREVFLHEKTDPREFLEFGSEIWKGRYTLVRNVKPKEGRRARRVAKIMPYDPKRPEDSLREYDMLKNVRQEHIVRLYESYQNDDSVVLVFEKLYGENVARSLSLKNRYSEQQVSAILKQVLDALQFLHHRGIVHLNLQPDNVIMVSRRRMDIKLIDFGRARTITTYEGERVERIGTAEFMAPEKVAKEDVGVAADVWGVGLLAYILLSGTSPFQGQEDEDTYSNVLSVRYDAHQIYHNVTKYALKFIYQTLKRNAKSRLTTEECLEHRWLMLNTPMIKMRKAAIFPTEKLRLFEEDYIRRRLAGSKPDEKLMAVYGIQDRFSDSEDDLFPPTD